MKKIITLFVLVLAVSFLAGCGKKQVQENNQVNKAGSNQKKETVQNQEQKKETEMQKATNTLKSAMESGKKMKCTYNIEMGGQKFQSEMYVDNGKFKTISTLNGDKNYSLSDGEMFYNWSEKEMKGSKMSKQCSDELKNMAGDAPTSENMKTDPDDFDTGAMDVKCEAVSSVDFTVPRNVEFSDSCEMMKKSMEIMQQLKNQGAGSPIAPPQGAIPGGSGQ